MFGWFGQRPSHPDLLLGLERLAAVAVAARCRLLVDVAGVVDRLDELPAADVVPLLAGLDEVVERDLERLPDLLELPGHVVDSRPWARGPARRRAAATLIGVLVVAHQEVDGVALHPAEPGLHVGADLLERRADVRPAVGIVDRRGDDSSALCVRHPHPRSPARRSGRLIRPSQSATRPASIFRRSRTAAVRSPPATGPIYHKRRTPDEGTGRSARSVAVDSPARRRSVAGRAPAGHPGGEQQRARLGDGRRDQVLRRRWIGASASTSGRGRASPLELVVVGVTCGVDVGDDSRSRDPVQRRRELG